MYLYTSLYVLTCVITSCMVTSSLFHYHLCLSYNFHCIYYFIHIHNSVPTTPPANVSAVALNSNAIKVSWDAMPINIANGIIRKYLLNVTVLESQENWTVETPHVAVTLNDLHPYYTFTIQVGAHTIGLGPFSYPQTLKTLQDGELSVKITTSYFHFLIHFIQLPVDHRSKFLSLISPQQLFFSHGCFPCPSYKME